MKITKTYTKTYELFDAAKWGMTFGATIENRKKQNLSNKELHTCFICDYEFKDDGIPYLGLIRGNKNVFLCDKCGKGVANGESKTNDNAIS